MNKTKSQKDVPLRRQWATDNFFIDKLFLAAFTKELISFLLA